MIAQQLQMVTDSLIFFTVVQVTQTSNVVQEIKKRY